MLYKIFFAGSLGLIFGYIFGYYIDYNESYIKLSFILFFTSLFFIKFFKKDKILKSIVIFNLLFLMFFIFGTIRAHLLKVNSDEINISNNFNIKITNINIKDNIKTIDGKILNSEISDFENKKIVLYLYGNRENYYPDDILQAKGNVQNKLIILPKRNENTGFIKSFDLAKYWDVKGVEFISMYPNIESVERFDISKDKHTIYYYSYKFRESFFNNLNKTMNNENAGISMAMLWGDERGVSKENNQKYIESGVSHILVLSGYNLIIIISFIMFIFKKYSIKSKVIFSIISLIVFLTLANSGITVFRAAAMSFYSIMAMYFLKPENSRFSLWLTIFIFVLYSPKIALFDISFHLSVLATMSLIYFYPLINNLFSINTEKEKMSKIKLYLYEVSIITIAANILIIPYLLFNFGYFKITGVFLSIFVTFFIPFIMLFSFLSGVFYYISSTLGKIFGILADWTIVPQKFFVNNFYTNKPILENNISFLSLIIIYAIIILLYFYMNFCVITSKSTNAQNKKEYQ